MVSEIQTGELPAAPSATLTHLFPAVKDGVAVHLSLAQVLALLTDGEHVQSYDAGLASIAALVSAANKFLYLTDVDTYALADLTAAGRALLDDADAKAQRATLGATGNFFKETLITASGTHAFHADTVLAEVIVIGGGGAGGGSIAGADAASSGGGGGSGEISRKILSTSGIASGTVVIGAGGTGVAAVVGGVGQGGNGGSSSWSDGTNTISAGGGVGGEGNSNSTYTQSFDGGAGGTGGAASGGFITRGQAGTNSLMIGATTGGAGLMLAQGGIGGSTPFGVGGSGGKVRANTTANDSGAGGHGYGSGGGGHASCGAIVGYAGGDGGPGIVVVREYK